MSPAACWRRVKQLEERGVIQNYAAILDHSNRRALISVFLFTSRYQDTLKRTWRSLSWPLKATGAIGCYATTGTPDFILRVVASDIEAYDQF